MISVCVEGDTIAIYHIGDQGRQVNMTTYDVAGFLRNLVGLPIPDTLTNENLEFDDSLQCWRIKLNDERFHGFMDAPTHEYLRRNSYSLGAYLNGVILAHIGMMGNNSLGISSSIFYETNVSTTTSTDIFMLIEKAKNVSLELRDPNNGHATRMEVIVPPNNRVRADPRTEDFILKQLAPYRKAISRWAERRTMVLAEKLANAEVIFSRQGFASGLKLSTQGWKYEENSSIFSGPQLVYTKKIFVQQIWDGARMWNLPDEMKQLMWIQNLRTPIGTHIQQGYAEGFQPHCNGDEHGRSGSVCLGDLQGRPFSQIDKLIDQYKTVNMGSNYGNTATVVCEILLNRRNVIDMDAVRDPEMRQKLELAEQFRGYCSDEGVARKKGFMNKLRKAAGVPEKEEDDPHEETNSAMEVWIND